jgi:cysteine desulfurase family protein (TIGR01976 family)
MPLDVAELRKRFPSLARSVAGAPAVFADAPGGTQVPEPVVEAMAAYLRSSNANQGGAFVTSEETDEVVDSARRAAGDLLGCGPGEIVFGPNMTTLAFALSRALVRELSEGDEVVVTRLDHDANVAPWVAAAGDSGATLRWVDMTPDCRLDPASVEAALSERTRIVAFPLASNAVGTVTDAASIVAMARAAGAIAIGDAVHYAPHGLIDVRSLDIDVLFCSPYKFFGPHLGVMYARAEHLDRLRPYKVRPASDRAPDRWETGTKNHEALAGLVACVDYIASLGEGGSDAERRAAIVSSFGTVQGHERELSERFLTGIEGVEGVTLYGVTGAEGRTPTFAVRRAGETPRETARRLGDSGVFVWDGNYYAIEVMEALGLESTGGAVRIGFCHYNTIEEVDRVVGLLGEHV